QDGLQNNSIPGELHHVRLQTPHRATHPGDETTRRRSRPSIPRDAQPYAPHYRQEIRNGSVSDSVSASDRLTLIMAEDIAAVVRTADYQIRDFSTMFGMTTRRLLHQHGRSGLRGLCLPRYRC